MARKRSYLFECAVRQLVGRKMITFSAGSVVEMDQKAAEELIELHGGREVDPSELDVPKPEGAKLVEALVEAIPGLSADEDFTKSGSPAIAALEKLLGYDITAEERDAGFDAYQKANPDLFKGGK